MVESFDYAVVGAGIVGLAVARRLLAERPDASLVVLDKESAVASHQTGHSSGVVHAGVYYAPGSLKARLCRAGAVALRDYCREKGVAYREIGKLVVARDGTEVERLRELHRRSLANGVPGIEWLGSAEITALEPGIVGRAALLSPSTAVVDFAEVARAYARDVAELGGEVRTGAEVSALRRHPSGVDVVAGGRPLRATRVVLCGGLHSDRLAVLAGAGPDPRIVPFRGEYLRLRPQVRDRVGRLVYPVPDPAYPFLGVHLTPRIDGEVDIGPNAVLALSREGYRRRDVSARDVVQLVGAPAFRRLAGRNWRAGVHEVRGSLSRRAFLSEVRSYAPWLRPEHVVAGPSGVRAQAVDADGGLVDDFRLGIDDQVVAVRNAPSPAATASLAIADHVVRLMHGGPSPA